MAALAARCNSLRSRCSTAARAASSWRSNSVLIAEEDWAAIQETLFLLSIPGMRESIKAGMAEPADACATEIDW